MGPKIIAKRPQLLEAIIDGDRRSVDALLAAGADPNVSDTAGWTALHFAAQRQDVELLRRLFKAGANVDAVDCYGNTPLFRAVFSYCGSPTTIAVLKAAGADENKANNHGVSPRSLSETIANTGVSAAFRRIYSTAEMHKT